MKFFKSKKFWYIAGGLWLVVAGYRAYQDYTDPTGLGETYGYYFKKYVVNPFQAAS
jgi:hypothetical protein